VSKEHRHYFAREESTQGFLKPYAESLQEALEEKNHSTFCIHSQNQIVSQCAVGGIKEIAVGGSE
jgi:hypothetical protein